MAYKLNKHITSPLHRARNKAVIKLLASKEIERKQDVAKKQPVVQKEGKMGVKLI